MFLCSLLAKLDEIGKQFLVIVLSGWGVDLAKNNFMSDIFFFISVLQSNWVDKFFSSWKKIWFLKKNILILRIHPLWFCVELPSPSSPVFPPLSHTPPEICIWAPWQRLMFWFSGSICLWGRQLLMLETTCPGASHARRMTDCLCSVFSWVVFISSVSLWYCSPDHYRTCISKVCQNSWSGAKRWTSKWEGIYTVNPVTNPIYIYRHPCFGLLHMLMPGNSHFFPRIFCT